MDKIKKGRFAIFCGREYEIYENEDGSYNLVSKNSIDLKNGFIEKYSDTYIKKVNKDEISSVCRIVPYGIYKHEKFDVSERIKNGMINLGTTNKEIAKKLSFVRTDKYFYEKWVPKNEVELFEEREKFNLE